MFLLFIYDIIILDKKHKHKIFITYRWRNPLKSSLFIFTSVTKHVLMGPDIVRPGDLKSAAKKLNKYNCVNNHWLLNISRNY